jgi:hypothetical protein
MVVIVLLFLARGMSDGLHQMREEQTALLRPGQSSQLNNEYQPRQHERRRSAPKIKRLPDVESERPDPDVSACVEAHR